MNCSFAIGCKPHCANLTKLQRLLFQWAGCLLVLAFSREAYGQKPSSPEEKLSAISQDQIDPLNKPVENQIQMASKLLKTELTKETSNLGRIEDIAFDLETGHLAVLVAAKSEVGKEVEWTMLPFVHGDRLVKFAWEKATKLTTTPMTITRMQVNEVYRLFQQAVYWLEFATQYEAEPGHKFDDQDFKLIFFSNLKKMPVSDSQGRVIGRIDDVALKASNGTIIYMVMQTEDNRLRAIPLGAFVADEKNNRWFIELTKDQIQKFKTFEENTPPPQIETDWKEYVAVKYGRGGLQANKSKK